MDVIYITHLHHTHRVQVKLCQQHLWHFKAAKYTNFHTISRTFYTEKKQLTEIMSVSLSALKSNPRMIYDTNNNRDFTV